MKTLIILILYVMFFINQNKIFSFKIINPQNINYNKKLPKQQKDTNEFIRGKVIIIDTNKVQRALVNASVYIYKNQINYKNQKYITSVQTDSTGSFNLNFGTQSKQISNPFFILIKHPNSPIRLYKIFKSYKLPYTFELFYQIVSQKQVTDKDIIPPDDNPKQNKRKRRKH